MPYAVRWELRYRHLAPVMEEPEGTAIMTAPRFAVAMVVTCEHRWSQYLDIPAGFRPIWYRQRGITMGGQPELLATVCGYGKMTGAGNPEVTLFEANSHGLVNARPEVLDRTMVELQLED